MSEKTSLKQIPLSDADTLRELAIRSYRAAYAGQLRPDEIQARIEKNHRSEDFAELLQNKQHSLWGLYQKAKLVAYLELSNKKSETDSLREYLHLCRIYVEPTLKGQGLAKTLMQKAEDEARTHKRQGLWLHCFDQNTEALDFYRRGGFRIVGRDPFTILPGRERFDAVLVKDLR